MKTVLLTNENGDTLEKSEIMAAHTNGGKLHKAFSIVIYSNDKSKMLIQKRAPEKMLWAGYWANTCCSHPKEEQSIEQEAAVRLEEECGFTCPLYVHSSFTYKADDPNGNGTEHEYDTILTGQVDEDIALQPDPAEIEDIQWISLEDLRIDMKAHPTKYTPWFHRILEIL